MWETWSDGHKKAIDILSYIGRNYTIHMENQEVDFPTIAFSFLAHQIRCLVQSTKPTTQTAPAGSHLLDSLTEALAVHFGESNCDLADFLAAHRHFKRSTDSYDWPDPSEYVVSTAKRSHLDTAFQLTFPTSFAVDKLTPSMAKILLVIK